MARRWYREQWRPVTVVIPTYGDPALVDRRRSRACARRPSASACAIVVVDDGSPDPAHRERLRRAARTRRSSCSEANGGFAAAANRGIARGRAGDDVVRAQLRRVAQPGWLERLQYAAYRAGRHRHRRAEAALPRRRDPVGRLLPQPRRAGVVRPPLPLQATPTTAPANITAPVIGGDRRVPVRQARRARRRSALLDEALRMAYEDMDWCLRGWEAGCRVYYAPRATLMHLESQTRADRAGRARARLPAACSGSAGAVLRRARRAHRGRRAADRLRDRGHRRRRRPPRHLRAPQPAAPSAATTSSCSRSASSPTGSPLEVPDAHVRGLRRARRRARAARGDQGRDLVEHRAARSGCASVRHGHPRLLRPGHRDVATTPTTQRDAGTRARRLPARVPLHDDLGLEPRAAARARAATPSSCRPGIDLEHVPPARRTCAAATTCCSRSGAPTRSRTCR